MDTNFYTQAGCEINGRHVWFYLITSPIGDTEIIQYEMKSYEIKEYVFRGEYEKAEKKYQSLCLQMIKGKI